MHLAAYQIILITIYAFIAINDSYFKYVDATSYCWNDFWNDYGRFKTGLMVGGTPSPRV